jgi:hypothetical protein
MVTQKRDHATRRSTLNMVTQKRDHATRRMVTQKRDHATRRCGGLPVVLALVLLFAAGCGPTRGGYGDPTRGGYGDPPHLMLGMTPPEVLAAHNAWADSIRHIWSRAAISLVMPRGESRGERVRYDTEGHLFLVKADRLFLHGQVLGQEVFKMGMNDERFWLWIRPRVNTVWTGCRGGEGEGRFILSPADLLAVLGVFPVELSADEPAAFDTQPRQYVLTQQRRFGGEKVPLKRTWFDRQTLRPVRIDLFDDSGARVAMAELMRYERLGETDVCTACRIRFYGDDEVDLVLQLSDVRLDKEPPAGVFLYKAPPDARVEDLDAGPPKGERKDEPKDADSK